MSVKKGYEMHMKSMMGGVVVFDPGKYSVIVSYGADGPMEEYDPRPELRKRVAAIKWWKVKKQEKKNLLEMINSPDMENVVLAESLIEIKEKSCKLLAVLL